MSGSSAMSVSGIRFLWYGLSTLLPMRSWLVGAMMVGLVGAAAQPAPRPNVVVILADDQGWGDLGITGNTNLSTPHIDSLARDGAMLPHFFVSPVCSPTRAEFLTGRYHPRGGVCGTSARGERLDLDEATIAQTFKAAGYATGCLRQVAQRQPVSVPPQRPRLRRVLRLHLGPLGRVLRPAAGAQRQAQSRQGLHHRRPDRPRDGVHRAATAAGRSSATSPTTRRTRRCRCRTGSTPSLRDAELRAARDRTGDARTLPTRAPPWRWSRTSTGTSAGC